MEGAAGGGPRIYYKPGSVELLAKLIIPGAPTNKKNSPILYRRKGKDGQVRPGILPSRDFQKWEKGAIRYFDRRRDLRRPLAESGELLLLNALFFLAPRQRPDLPGLLEAVCDALEKGGLIANDYWINSFGRSRRIWPPKGGSKAAKAARAAWVPRTEAYIYTTGERR